VHDASYTTELLVGNSANGFRDLLAIIDLSTYRRLPWEGNMPLFLVNFVTPETGLPLEVDPRNVLQAACKRAEEAGRWKLIAGLELEVGCASEGSLTRVWGDGCPVVRIGRSSS